MPLTDEQLRLRLTGIGGSEIAAIVGEDPYKRPIDVCLAKWDPQPSEDTHHTERGKFFERPTADWWAHRHGAKLRETGTLIHPKHRIVLATPDFVAMRDGGELDLSVKVPGPRTLHRWGEPGTDEVPPYAYLQVQWELAILGDLHGITRAVVVGPHGANGDLAEYPIEADRDLQDHLIGSAERFWKDHIEPKRPPPPDASEAFTGYIRKRFPESGAAFVKADAEACSAAQRLQKARAALVAAEREESTARQLLEMKIGNADGIEGPGWRISFKMTKGRPSTDWSKLCEGAGITQAVIDSFTSRTPFRQFRVSFKGKTDE